MYKSFLRPFSAALSTGARSHTPFLLSCFLELLIPSLDGDRDRHLLTILVASAIRET